MAGLRSSLDLLDREGSADQRLATIRSKSAALWDQLQRIDAITTLLDAPPASGLVSFQIADERNPADWVQKLGNDGTWIRDLADPACLRACTHVCTTTEEIDALLQKLRDRAG